MNEPRVDRRALATVYGHGAETYDALWSPVIRPAAVDVVNGMELEETTRVLDVGAGTGALTDALRTAAPAASIVSIDPASAMLRVARERWRVTAINADASALPCARSSVDAVLLAYVLFHLLDPSAGLREAARVVRRGGRVGTVTWASESPPDAAKVWEQALDELDAPRLPAHGNHDGLDTADDISALLDGAGLCPVQVWIHEIEHTFTPGSFWRLRTGCGCNRARIAALDCATREQKLPEIRRRLEQLAPTDYTFRGAVVCSVSQKIQ
jgi:ubiquinone/menaquinone biosynthesis C-methylase UbiE